MALLRAATAAQQVLPLLLLGLSRLPLVSAVPAHGYDTNSTTDAAKLGAVASESAVCSNIGIELLQQGGNAIDALVGTTFCVGVIGMYHSGIGGGGFMLVRGANGSKEFIDFRETAAASYTQDMYVNDTDLSLYGGLAAGVPGELRGLEYAHKTYDPAWSIDFAPNGTLVQEGQIMTRKRYADTLETISEEGADAFYKGPIAESTIAALQAANGTMTLDDLANYTIELREPVSIDYRGYKLTSCSAPSGGEVALSILNIVNGYEGFGDPSQINLTTHRLDEAMRWSYGMRTNLGDPSFVDGMAAYQAEMLSQDTAAEIRSKIYDDRTFNGSWYNPNNTEVLSDHGTSHIVSADQHFAISLVTTINTIFGSRVMTDKGVILNNEMDDFSTPGGSVNAFGYEPSANNFIQAGKRPLSSIAPTIAEYPSSQGGGLFFLSGSAGGSRIITATAQVLHHAVDQGMTAHEALLAPRMHDQLSPDRVEFEYAFDNQTTAFLAGLGHTVQWVAPGGSTSQALRRLPNGTFEAAGEPRQLASGGFAI